MYRALPSNLEIKDSKIDGQGLFAKEDIPSGTNLGLSHMRDRADWIRTPLGGFYNHSDDPNCIKHKRLSMYDHTYSLWTIKDIKAGEELTVTYTLYKVK